MSKHKISLILALISSIVLTLIFLYKSGLGLNEIQCSIKGCGFFAPFIFITMYLFAPVFFLPITPLSITAGVLFGPIWGTIYTVFGATAGGTLAFLTSRYLIKDWIDQKTPGRVAIVKEKIKQEGWQFVALSRITPIFPFNVQNYIFGVTDIDLKTFFFTSLISLIPGSFVYVYIGYAGKSLFGEDEYSQLKIASALIILVLFMFLPKIINYIKKKRTT